MRRHHTAHPAYGAPDACAITWTPHRVPLQFERECRPFVVVGFNAYDLPALAQVATSMYTTYGALGRKGAALGTDLQGTHVRGCRCPAASCMFPDLPADRYLPYCLAYQAWLSA